VSQWLQKGVAESQWDLSGFDSTSDTTRAESGAYLSDKTVYVTGTFDSAVITLEGSNNNASGTFVNLKDPQGNVITWSATTSGIDAVLHNPMFIKPRCSGATGGSSGLTVILIQRGAG
jgi:hypothetical protein